MLRCDLSKRQKQHTGKHAHAARLPAKECVQDKVDEEHGEGEAGAKLGFNDKEVVEGDALALAFVLCHAVDAHAKRGWRQQAAQELYRRRLLQTSPRTKGGPGAGDGA